MSLRSVSLADALLEESWTVWSYRHLPESWWPVVLCVEPPAVLS